MLEIRIRTALMHISEGFLPLTHAAVWAALAAPFAGGGIARLNSRRDDRFLVAASAGYLFALTALKLPSVAGSSSHPTGVAVGTLLAGPVLMPALALVVLLFQALLTGHGGLTTLGANLVSLGVVGPWITWGLWRMAVRAGAPAKVAVMLGAFGGSLATYACTAGQLALAHPDAGGGVAGAFVKFAAVFAVTQVPISAVEAVFSVTVLGVFERASGWAASGREAWVRR